LDDRIQEHVEWLVDAMKEAAGPGGTLGLPEFHEAVERGAEASTGYQFDRVDGVRLPGDLTIDPPVGAPRSRFGMRGIIESMGDRIREITETLRLRHGLE